MITYELMLLIRVMPKPELVSTLRRTADTIFNQGGIIRKLQNLGTRDMTFKISAHGMPYRKARITQYHGRHNHLENIYVHKSDDFYLVEFIAPPANIDKLLDEYGRDIDIIKRNIFKKKETEKFECTLQEELQPPPYRKEVQELVEKTKSLEKPKFKYNTGLGYYPFQK